MKHYLPIALGLACAVLVIILVVMKNGADTQHETDSNSITDYSNQLSSAHTQLAGNDVAILSLSNNLDASQSASLSLSNNLADAQTNIALDLEQITNLNQKIADVWTQNQGLGETLTYLTNQMNVQVASLTGQLNLTTSNLDQANKDYGLLENRLRRNVAERLVMERQFNNLSELQAQMQKLKSNPTNMISEDSIYAGLDVEVKSNQFHVISPN